MAISEMIGGMSQLTAVFVVLTALTGALLGPSLIRICRIKTAIAKGIMLERAQMEPVHQKHSKSVLWKEQLQVYPCF